MGDGADNWRSVAASLFPQGHSIEQHGAFLTGSAQLNGKPVAVAGTCGHTAIGVEIALAQARAVLDIVRHHPGRPIVLLVDTQGQRLRRRDEMLGIHSYMAHLAQCIDLARRRGHKVIALVYGQALSGGFVATGLMANACYALQEAAIRVMALPAMSRITKVPLARLEQLAADHPVFAPGPENFRRMGGLTAIWERPAMHAQLTMALHDCPQQDFRAAQGAQRGGRKLAAAIIDAIVENRHA
ncbi:biotin-independent malonate decarboxylase subunit gamma [Duganella ginsengisoli]|uniref:Biotin-independent malonate decarboxylase subunit gamma n=1 Tax=Pseudoduganella ginsengisoli TaxID=1462440 RepID=A0A6L6PW01_9BURK|nr:biotin-independent malonate decarboxylase subunit gamma [Pseudoduganella ginsengisoli]